MDLTSYLRTDPEGTDAQIAERFNALPDRFAPEPLTINELADALVARAGLSPSDALELGMRLAKDAGDTWGTGGPLENALLAKRFALFVESDAVIDFSTPFNRFHLSALAGAPGPFTVPDLNTVASILQDTQGGTKTEADVAAARAAVRKADAVKAYRTETDRLAKQAYESKVADRAAGADLIDAWDGTGEVPTAGD